MSDQKLYIIIKSPSGGAWVTARETAQYWSAQNFIFPMVDGDMVFKIKTEKHYDCGLADFCTDDDFTHDIFLDKNITINISRYAYHRTFEF